MRSGPGGKVIVAPTPDGLRLTNGDVDLRVATGYGPRVTHYGFAGGPNVFGDGCGVSRETPHGLWRAYGGHRLWAAPERFPETYTIDDAPPQIDVTARSVTLRRASDPRTGLAFTIHLELAARGSEVAVRHTIVNEGSAAQRLAPWGITVVPPDGEALIPNALRRAQRDALLPARTLTLWHYASLDDPRFRFGAEFLRVQCDPSQPAPAKIGAANERGWFAYLRERTAFLVRATYDAAAEYPDRGASVEIYTEGGFCEMETLGPLVTLAPGSRTEHDLRWSLAAVDDQDEAALARLLERHAAR